MKKVLITCLYYKEANPVLAIAVAKSLVYCGYDVYALLEKDTVNRQAWIELIGVEKIEFISIAHFTKILPQYSKYINVLRYSILSEKKLFPKFYRIEFDYVLYTFYHHWNDLLIKKIHAKQNVLFLHDPIPHSGESENRLRQQKHQAKMMDHIVLLSRKFIPIVQQEYDIDSNRIHFMRHGAMDYQKDSNLKKVELNKDMGLNFLFFGRITEYKGIDVLLKAYDIVQKDIKDCHLTIAGNGDFSRYKSLISDESRITIINRYINDSEIAGFFATDNTVVILPYIDATQSGVIPIAASYGNPVIASNIGGLREQLNDGSIGIIVEAGNVDALAESMIEANFCRNLLEEQSMKMNEYNRSLDWDVIVNNLMDELEM